MTGIQALTSEPGIVRLGWTLLHFLWQGTAIAVLYAIVRFLFARSLTAHGRYALGCSALMAMTAAPLLTFVTISGGAIPSAEVTAWARSMTEWKWLPQLVVGLWIVGVFGFSIRLLGAFRFTRRLRASSHPVPDVWQKALNQIAARMGRPVSAGVASARLMGSSLVNVPAVIGHLQPVILVPVAFLTRLPAEHIMALLAHEMAHIRRNDYIAGILQSVAEVALFYHPAVWWISGQIRAERELCCDDLAIAAGTDSLTYARALTELESRRHGALEPQMAANGGSLMERIRRLIEPSYPGGHYLPGTASAWTMLLLWLVGAGVAVLPAAQKATTSAPASFAGTRLVQRSIEIPAPVSNPLDALAGQARKTLLFDPIFSAQLALPPAPGINRGQAAQATRLVAEAVTPKDASGGIIEGLTKEDFTVTEDGTLQEVSLFDFENTERLANSAPSRPTRLASPLARLPQAEITPESAGQLRYKDHKLVALYFDVRSMSAPDQLRTLGAAQKFVNTQMSGADLVCLMQYTGGGVEVLQDFTGDRDRLLSVIATMAGGSATQVDSGTNGFDADHRLAALGTAARMLGSLSEKKSLVYFSGGLNLSGTDNLASLRAAAGAAVRSGVSIWPLDIRNATAPSDDALTTLGADTGGKAILDSGDPAGVIVAAEKSITSYYILGYTATNDASDGRLRRVKIALNRNSDAKLDYRQAYFAGKAFVAATTADDKEHQLQDALVMGDPATDLSIAAEVNYFRLNNAEYFSPITLKIPGSEFVAAKKTGADHTALDLIGEVKDEQGTTISNFRDLVDIRLSDSSEADLTKRTITYNTGALVLPGAYSIRILARDSVTGKIGTYIGRFAVANLNKDTQVPITSVVLSSELTDGAAPDAGLTGRAAAGIDPLVHDGKRLTPSVTRVFSSKSDMIVYLQAYERAATATVPLTASVAFYKGSVKVLESPALKITEGLDAKSKMLPIQMNVALASLKPGEYDCQVTVVDPATQKSTMWQKPVTIIP